MTEGTTVIMVFMLLLLCIGQIHGSYLAMNGLMRLETRIKALERKLP